MVDPSVQGKSAGSIRPVNMVLEWGVQLGGMEAIRIPTTDSWHVWLPGWRRGRRPQRGQSLCDTLFKGWPWCLEVCLLESYSDPGNRNIVLGEPQVWQNTAQKLGCVLIARLDSTHRD